MSELEQALKLLREARRILLANSVARNLHKDYLQRSQDFIRKAEKK